MKKTSLLVQLFTTYIILLIALGTGIGAIIQINNFWNSVLYMLILGSVISIFLFVLKKTLKTHTKIEQLMNKDS